MNLNRRLKRLESHVGDTGACPACKGNGGPLYHAEFLSGEPAVEGGQCTHCNGVGARPMSMKRYLMTDRATLDAV